MRQHLVERAVAGTGFVHDLLQFVADSGHFLYLFVDAGDLHLRELYGIDLRDWTQQGDAFVVHSHEIRYLRPALYNEPVAIQSSLIGAGDTWLLVEMLMLDKDRQLKAVLWTRFTHINPKTGRKEAHSAKLEKFIQDALVEGVDLAAGVGGRITELRTL